MSLLDRTRAAETCAVVGCDRHRVPDSLFCREHLNEMWANRLVRQPDGSFTERRVLPARDQTGWAA